MIELELPQAIAVYSVALATLVVLIWLYTELSVRRPQRALGKQFLWRCHYCGCSYLDEGAAAYSRCPRCESWLESPGTVNPPAPREDRSDEVGVDAARGSSRRKRPHQRRRGPRRRR